MATQRCRQAGHAAQVPLSGVVGSDVYAVGADSADLQSDFDFAFVRHEADGAFEINLRGVLIVDAA